MDLTTIWNAIASDPLLIAGASAVLGAAVPLGVSRAYDSATGRDEVRNNAANISRRAANYHLFSPKLPTATDIRLDGQMPGGVGSLMQLDEDLHSVTCETAQGFHFIRRNAKDPAKWSIHSLDLTSRADAARYLACLDHPLDPAKVEEILSNGYPAQASPAKAAELCRSVASRAKPTRVSSWTRAASAEGGLLNAVDQAMTQTLIALAASAEPEINLSGRCHLAVKYAQEGQRHIHVRILTPEERDAAAGTDFRGDFGAVRGEYKGRQALEQVAQGREITRQREEFIRKTEEQLRQLPYGLMLPG